jgi:6-phosphogluconolactonase
MVHEVIGEMKKFPDLEELSSAAALDISKLIDKIVSSKGVFYLALSGGNTPQTLYHVLGTTYAKSIPWDVVHIFFCDERYVSHEAEQSNYRMVKENLLDLVSIPQRNIHPIPTDNSNMKIAASAYETELRRILMADGSTFDLAIMGIGKEGHTASLFPGSSALDEKRRWALGVEVNAVPPRRITLTYSILNRTAVIYFIVSGSGKAEVMEKILGGAEDFRAYPAVGIQPNNGRLFWWVDYAVLSRRGRV